MRIQDHIPTISWTLLDKLLFVLFGFVQILIINYTNIQEYALFALLLFINSWISTISDSYALQMIIQFGMNEKERKFVNTIALLFHIVITSFTSFTIFFLSDQFGLLFNEKRLEEIALFLPILSISSIPKAFTQKLMYQIQQMFFVFLSNFIFFGLISFLILYSILNSINLNFYLLSHYYLIGTVACSIMSIILTRKQLKFNMKGNVAIKNLLSFSIKITSINLLNSIPRNIEPFIIKLFFSLEVVGLYSAAKNLFRLFDEALNAFYGIIYPATVKHLNSQNHHELDMLTKKSISFVFVSFFIIALLILSPIGYFVLESIFPIQYTKSINYLTLFLVSVPFLSFVIFYSLLTASNKLGNVFTGVFVANISFLIVLALICLINNSSLIPLGIVVYNIILGLIGLYYGIKFYNYRIRSLMSAIPDSYNFIKKKIQERI